MSQTNKPDTHSTSRIGEVIADIAFMAGNLHGTGKLHAVEDSRALMGNIINWANLFEEAFDLVVHGDDYLELIDAYAEFCLLGKEEDAARLLAGMNRCKAIRYAPAESTTVLTFRQAPASEMASQDLPNPAKCALEYLGCQPVKTIDLLNRYLDHYFKVQGEVCDDRTRNTCVRIATQRYHLNDQVALAA